MGSYPVMLKLLNSTTNPGQPLAAKWALGGALWSRGPARGHLAAKGCPGFVVKFNNYSITGYDPVSLTSLWHRAPRIIYVFHPNSISNYF